MHSFDYHKPKSTDAALSLPAHSKFLAGGTTLIDLMKLNVEKPDHIYDVNALPFHEITEQNGSILIGALTKNAEVAYDPQIASEFPALSEAILAGASAQLRNKASTAGNILQRTRCVYFRDSSKACNKREPGSGCAALDGHHRNLAILGTSDHCIANNPSDQNVALMALDASLHLEGASGKRVVPISKFYTLPGNTPHIETALKPGELITRVSIEKLPTNSKSTYVKLRDRQSYEFALASAAVIAKVVDGKFESLRIAMGGIGSIPWRCWDAETFLIGKAPTKDNFAEAARLTLKNAKPRTQNEFKVELAKRCLTHALSEVSA